MHVVDRAAGGGSGFLQEQGDRAEVRVPADPAVVGGVHVVVDVAGRTQRGQRVTDAVDVGAVLLDQVTGRSGARVAAGVGVQVRQRVDLDDVDDPEVLIRRVTLDCRDRIDELGLVAGQLVRFQFTVRGERSAVPAGQVVDDELDVVRPLAQRLVQVIPHAHRSVGLTVVSALDSGDPVDPDGGRRIRNPIATGHRLGLGLPLRIHVAHRVQVRIIDPASGWGGGGGWGGRRRRGGSATTAAGHIVEGERRRFGVATTPRAVEADVDRGAAGYRTVVRLVLYGDVLPGLAIPGRPAVHNLLTAVREGKAKGPAVERLTGVLDTEGGGETAGPVIRGIRHLALGRGVGHGDWQGHQPTYDQDARAGQREGRARAGESSPHIHATDLLGRDRSAEGPADWLGGCRRGQPPMPADTSGAALDRVVVVFADLRCRSVGSAG